MARWLKNPSNGAVIEWYAELAAEPHMVELTPEEVEAWERRFQVVESVTDNPAPDAPRKRKKQ